MQINGNYLNDFKQYLVGLRNDLNKTLKDNYDVIYSENRFEIDKYKSLLFKKNQIEYFISLIRRNDCLDETEIFVSYKSLSDLIYSSPLDIDAKFKTAVYFFRINSNSVLPGSISVPSVECILDNFNSLMDLPVNRIKSFCNSKDIFLELGNTKGKVFKEYSKRCDNITSMYKLSVSSMIGCINEGFDGLDFNRIDHIVECITLLSFNSSFVNDIKDYLYSELVDYMDRDEILVFFEDNSSWFQKACDDLSITAIYVMMLHVAVMIVDNKDEDKTKYYCELDGYIKYVMKSIKERFGDDYIYPPQLKKYQKILK